MPDHTRSNIWEFARKERRGTLLILSFILLLCAFPFLLPFIYKGSISGQVDIDSSLARLQAQKESVARNRKYQQQQPDDDDRRPYDHPSSYASTNYHNKGALFYFDPNTLDEAGWKRLGLREKTIATILNYRDKGGRFRQPEDIKKIWGLFPDEAERLIPYISIAEQVDAGEQKPPDTGINFAEKKSERKAVAIININAADSNAFVSLPGIGPKLSQRIINFRNKLGGFYSVEQVGETFGLPDSVFQKVKPYLRLEGPVKKININTASPEELRSHPYIRYHLANAIVQYRRQHGDFNSVDDLSKIMIMDADMLWKLEPYLTL